jgi:excisionase family DNA binding protein
MGTVADGANASQDGEKITGGEGASVQPSQPFAEDTKNFTTHLLPKSPGAAQLGRGAPTAPVGAGAWVGPGTAPPVETTPTVADLAVLYGGRGRLLRVAEVAEQLGVCNAMVYRLCESGELPHLRVVNSIRIRPADLADYVANSGAIRPPT